MVREIINKVKKIINNLARPGENLSESVVRGGFWVFSLRIVQQLFGLARLVILARILAPHDFGLMGISLLTMATLETFSQTGFQAALIQKKEGIRSHLDAAWTVLILRGFVLFAILYLIAPYVATFFNAPEATPIIQVIGLSFLIGAFTNIGVIYFQKELEFNKEFIYQFAGTLADFIVAVSAVLILRNVWALVFGLLAGNALRCFVSYLIHPYRPHLSRDLGKAKELFGFGKWILGSSILIFLLTQGDDIFVGKLLGVTALGFYQLAYRISNMPITEYSSLIAQVAFPAYAKLQGNPSKLREAYLKVSQLSAFLSILIAGGIFVLAPEFTMIFLGEKWMPMVPAMQVLAIYGMFGAIGITGPLFMAVGRPELRTKLQFVSLMIMATLIYPFTKWWGITGTSIAVTAYASTSIIAIYIALKIIKSDYKKPTKILLFPLINTLITVLVIFNLKTYIFNDIGLVYFLLLLSIGILTYLSTAYLFDLFFNYGSIKLVKEQFTILLHRKNYGKTNGQVYSQFFKLDLQKAKNIMIQLKHLCKKLVTITLKLFRYIGLTHPTTDELFETCICPICSSQSTKYLFSQKEPFAYTDIDKDHIFDLVKCLNCSMIYVNPRLKENIILEIYKRDLIETYKYSNSHQIKKGVLFDAYHDKINERKMHFSKIVKAISRKVTKGKILEVGSSFGYFLQECEEKGYQAYGIEPSKECTRFAREELEVRNIACASWEEDPFPILFDVVCMFSVIEHLYNPAGCLQYIDSRLKLGGYLFLTYPILKGELLWNDAHPVEHVNYFTEETLKKIVKDTINYEYVKLLDDELLIFRKPNK